MFIHRDLPNLIKTGCRVKIKVAIKLIVSLSSTEKTKVRITHNIAVAMTTSGKLAHKAPE